MRATVQYRLNDRWRKAFSGKLVFADKQLIIVRWKGSDSFFDGAGNMKCLAMKTELVPTFPKSTQGWRVSMESLAGCPTDRNGVLSYCHLHQ